MLMTFTRAMPHKTQRTQKHKVTAARQTQKRLGSGSAAQSQQRAFPLGRCSEKMHVPTAMKSATLWAAPVHGASGPSGTFKPVLATAHRVLASISAMKFSSFGAGDVHQPPTRPPVSKKYPAVGTSSPRSQ